MKTLTTKRRSSVSITKSKSYEVKVVDIDKKKGIAYLHVDGESSAPIPLF